MSSHHDQRSATSTPPHSHAALPISRGKDKVNTDSSTNARIDMNPPAERSTTPIGAAPYNRPRALQTQPEHSPAPAASPRKQSPRVKPREFHNMTLQTMKHKLEPSTPAGPLQIRPRPQPEPARPERRKRFVSTEGLVPLPNNRARASRVDPRIVEMVGVKKTDEGYNEYCCWPCEDNGTIRRFGASTTAYDHIRAKHAHLIPVGSVEAHHRV